MKRAAFALSLLLHGLLGLFLALRPDPPPPERSTSVFVPVELLEAAKPPAPSPPPQRARLKKRQQLAQAPAATPSPNAAIASTDAPQSSPAPLLSDRPLAQAGARLPPAPSLPIAERPRGITLRATDPQPSKEWVAAEDAKRVSERVQGWSQDVLADARVQGGLVDPYYGALGKSLEQALSGDEGGRPASLGILDGNAGLKKSYATAAAQYAKTGNPNFMPPGRTPPISERLKGRFGNEPGALTMLAQAQALETREALQHHVPLLSLILELKQSTQGAPLHARVLESSGNARFDAFVLRLTPEALARLERPTSMDKTVFHSVWQVEGWMQRKVGKKEQLAKALAPLAIGLPLTPFAEQLRSPGAEDADLSYRARLLRVY